MMRCQNGLRLSRLAPLLIVVRMNEPISGPWIDADRAEQAGAADHRRGDRLQFPAVALGRIADADAHGEQNADEARRRIAETM